MPSGGDNVLTIHTNNGVERFRIDSSGNVKVGSAATISPDGDVFFTGVCTATTLSGAASGLTGALPAISAASLTNVPAANVVGVHTSLTVTNATTTGTAVVGGGVTISESGIEASGIGITVANINGTQIGGRRNIIINGAMMVAQRGTSSTSTGYQTVDRFNIHDNGVDEATTKAQVDVASGTTPYTEGFRKALKITNGNQTGGAGVTDYIQIFNRIEAQDIANSGWNYLSTSSFVTLSFWIKSSVAQAFSGSLRTSDGTQYSYKFDTPSLSANTWTKVIKTIPGNSNLTFNNDNGIGMQVLLYPFLGTDYTTSNSDTETWVTAGNNYANDMTSTFYTTNDATFELTGVQLEVGSQATAFEHRSFGEELLLCQRYYYNHADGGTNYAMGGNGGECTVSESCTMYQANNMFCSMKFPTQMRAKPTLDVQTGTNYYISFSNGDARGYFTGSNTSLNSSTTTNVGAINNSDTGSSTSGHAAIWRTINAAARIAFSAEL